MNQYKRILISAILLVTLDFIFLSYNRKAFETQVVQIQRVFVQVKIIPVILCYLCLIVGLNYFILNRHRPVWEAFLFGAIINGVYDTTNLALFKKYDWKLALMDTLWGGTLMALTTMIVYNL